MSSVRRSVAFSAAGKYVSFGIAFFSSVVLARLLLPSEVGVYSVGAAVLAFAHVFRDFGVANYVVREAELDPSRLGTAFTVTLITSFTMGFLVLGASGFLADFFQEPGLIELFRVLSINFFVIPFNVIDFALLRRNMRFNVIALIDVCSASVYAAVAISLAYFGFSYMSLAWASLAGLLISLLITQAAVSEHSVMRPTLSRWREVVSFGGMSFALMLMTRMDALVPQLIVGRILNMQSVGLLSRAEGTIGMFYRSVVDVIGSVVYSHLAEEHRNGRSLAPHYLKSASYLSAVAYPGFGLLIFLAPEVVYVLYGANWMDAVPLVQWMAVIGLILPYWALNHSFLIVLGKLPKLLLLEGVLIICLLSAWTFGASQGLLFALKLVTLFRLIAVVPALWLLHRELDVGLPALLGSTVRSAALAVPVILLPLFLVRYSGFVDPHNSVLVFIVGISSGALAWLFGLFLVRHPMRKELPFYRSAGFA